jgi:hypothetical protein
MPLVISYHLLNVFAQLANKRGLKKMLNLTMNEETVSVIMYNNSHNLPNNPILQTSGSTAVDCFLSRKIDLYM